MRHTRKQAFTLAELLVVITVIALLAAVLLPFLAKTIHVQRRVQCAHQLEKIGQAYATRAVEGGRLAAIGWQQSLAEFVGGNMEVFICPEDEELAADPLATLREVYVEVFTGAVDDYNTNAWNVPLDEENSSEWVWRLSEEQFQDFQRAPGKGQGYNYSGYVPGADPTSYWFVFEDQGWRGGGDKDYWDILLWIHYGSDGIEIKPRRGQAGYNFNLAMGEGQDKQILLHDLKAAADRGESAKIPGGSSTGSYGMNSLSHKITKGKEKLLVLDYESTLAKGSDFESDTLDNWWEDSELFPLMDNGMPLFARHFGRCHVLFANGRVVLMDPREIDPDKAEARRVYWNP